MIRDHKSNSYFVNYTYIHILVTIKHQFSLKSVQNKGPPFPVKFMPHGQLKNQHQLPTSPASSSTKKISKISKSAHPSGPWTAQRSRQLSATLDFQGSTLQELSHSLKFTLDIYTLDINILDIAYLHCKHLDIGKNQHQLPASTTRQQH